MMTRTPFGRYRGWPLEEIPSWYVSWLEGLPDLREPLRSSVAAEAERRFGRTESDSKPNFTLPDQGVADELIDRGLRSMARAHHPDRPGGNHHKMVSANLAAAWLRAQLRRVPA